MEVLMHKWPLTNSYDQVSKMAPFCVLGVVVVHCLIGLIVLSITYLVNKKLKSFYFWLKWVRMKIFILIFFGLKYNIIWIESTKKHKFPKHWPFVAQMRKPTLRLFNTLCSKSVNVVSCWWFFVAFTFVAVIWKRAII